MNKIRERANRVIACIMSVVMAVGLMPLPAFATTGGSAGLAAGVSALSADAGAGADDGSAQEPDAQPSISPTSIQPLSGGLTALSDDDEGDFIEIGDGTITTRTNSVSSWDDPYYTPWQLDNYDSFSTQVYTKSDIAAKCAEKGIDGECDLTSVAFNLATSTAMETDSVDIYLCHTTSSTAPTSFTAPDDLVHVYSSNPTIGASTGWQTFEFGTGEGTASKFAYNGKDNLLVVMLTDALSKNSSAPKCYSTYEYNWSSSAGRSSVATPWNGGKSAYKITDSPNLSSAEYYPNIRLGVSTSEPIITGTSGDVGIKVGETGSIYVTAEAPEGKGSADTLSYQWYSVGTGTEGADELIEGETDATLNGLTASEKGSRQYKCVVTNSWKPEGQETADPKSVTSDVITVSFYDVEATKPTKAEISSDVEGGVVEQPATITLTGTDEIAAGEGVLEAPELTYQWYVSDTEDGEYAKVDGATGKTFSPSTAELSDKYYKFGVTNHYYGSKAEKLSEPYHVVVKGKEIDSASKLKEFADDVNSGKDYAGVTVKLTEDIDLKDYPSWTPIGSAYFSGSTYYDSSSKPFKGMFDGNHKVISNLSVDTTANGAGLFGCVSAAASGTTSVRDLVVEGSVKSPGRATGGVIGYVYGKSNNHVIIEGVGNRATVEGTYQIPDPYGYYSTEYESPAGGVIGSAQYCTVSKCYNKGNISTSARRVGGIAGKVSGSMVSSCYNTGNVASTYETANSQKYAYAGGICGEVGSNYTSTIDDCVNTGSIDASKNTGSKYYGAIEGSSSGKISSPNYYLSTSSDQDRQYHSNSNIAVSAGQLDGSAAYPAESETYLIDALNATGYEDTWLSGAAIEQASPMLEWEYVKGTPRITTQPVGATYKHDETQAALTIVAELPDEAKDGAGALSYQWYKTTTGTAKPATDEAIEGAIEASLAPGVAAGEDAYFYCVVTDTFGGKKITATSKVVRVKVYNNITPATPTFTTQPADVAVEQMGKANLTAKAALAEAATDGKGDITYEWFKCDDAKGTNPVAVGEGASFDADTTAQGETFYFCRATNTFDERTAAADSNVVKVTVSAPTISTAAELKAFADKVNDDGVTFEGVTITLLEDIDLSKDSEGYTAGDWTPIGGNDARFKGLFDGNGKVISGMAVKDASSKGYRGLFGYVASSDSFSAGVKNLTVKGTVEGKGSYVGGVVGLASGGDDHPVVIENVGSEVDLTLTTNSCYGVGGVLGAGWQGVKVSGCYHNGTVDAKQYYTRGVGGIAGQSDNSNYLEITSCYNMGSVETSYSECPTGGIVGSSSSNSSNVRVVNCVNAADIVVADNATTFGSIYGYQNENSPSSAADANYWVDGTSTRAVSGYSYNGDNPYNIVVTAEQFAGQAAYPTDSETTLLDALNAGERSGMWIDGADTADEHEGPALRFEKIVGKPAVSIEASATHVKSTGADPDANATLTVTASAPEEGDGSDGALTYQWYEQSGDKEASVIVGATEATYKATRGANEAVTYYCVVTNTWAGGSATRTSKPVTIDFYDFEASTPNVAASSSAEGTVEQTTHVTLSSEVTWTEDAKGKYETPELAYQWFSRTGDDEFAEIEGATDAKYEFDALKLGTVDYKLEVTNTYCGESRTAESAVVSVTTETIKVGDETKLREIAANVNKGAASGGKTYAGATIELAGDVELTQAWIPIGEYQSFNDINYYGEKSFQGTFDGKGHKISGLSVSLDYSYGALFGCVNNGTVKDLIVEGAVAGKSSSGTYYGGVIASAKGNVAVEKVANKVVVTGGQYAGGIIGYIDSWAKVAVTSSYNSAAVESTYSGYPAAGGLIGYFKGSSATIDGCYNGAAGTVKCASSDGYLGGLVGYASYDSYGTVKVTRSYNAGKTDDSKTSKRGGIFGYRYQDFTIDSASAWLDGTASKASGYIASDWGQYYGQNLPNASTEAQMKSKALVKALNAGEDGKSLGLFKVDTGNVNDGFPTVSYQGGFDIIDFSPAVATVKKTLDYTGSALTLPSSLVEVTFDGEKLAESIYELKAEDEVKDAGFYDVTVAAIDNGPDVNNLYSGETTAVIEVLGQSISAKAGSASVEKQTYTGKEVEPSVKIEGLTEGVDYEVAYYTDNVEVGTATVTVAGMGNYRGTLDVPFEIGKVDISTCDVKVADQRFTGQQVKPTATVTNGDAELVAGRDYQVVYPKSGNTEIGYGTVTIAGRGIYEGTAKCRFNIVGGDLAESGWIIKPITGAVSFDPFYGSGAKPTVTVVSAADENIVLNSKYYSVSYVDNTKTGTAMAKAAGRSGFSGELAATFEARSSYDEVNLEDYEATAGNVAFTGEVAEPTVIVEAKEGDRVLVEGIDYMVEIPKDAILPGTYTVTVTGTGNYYGVKGTIDAEFTVMGEVDLGDWAEITGLSDVPYSYSGKAFEPEVEVEVPGKTLVRGTDYELMFADNVKPGTASVLAVGLTDEFTGVKMATFTIKSTTFDRAGVGNPEIAAQVYTGEALEPELGLKNAEGVELKAGVDYLVTYSSNVDAGKGRALIVGWGGYLGSKPKFATFDIAPADQVISLGKAAKSGKYAFGKTIAMDASVTKGTGAITYESSDPSVATVDETGLVKVAKGSGKATITATAAGSANYNEASASIDVTAQKAVNTLTVKAANKAKIKFGAKVRTIAISKAYTIKNAKGKLSYKKKSGNKNITVNPKNGTITVKKGLKKGTYKIKVEVTAASDGNYKKASKTVETKVTVTK